MRNRDVEQKLRNAVERVTPDVLDAILSKCEDSRTHAITVRPKRRQRRLGYAFGSAAAAVALVFGALSVLNSRVSVLVTLDVNPSIELSVNGNDRVVGVEPGNADGVTVLDNMDLTNTPIDVAVNALIGSMLKHGYLREDANSVLLSVESTDGERSAALREELSRSISRQLDAVSGAVISQNITERDELQALADEYRISRGKAALARNISDGDGSLQFADLAKLSVNELNLLADSKRVEAEGMDARGKASETAYIGEEGALRTALRHAEIVEEEAELLYAELDYDDGLMVYDVEFYYGGSEYEYSIGADDGQIVAFDTEGGASPDYGELIGEDKAAEIAAAHSEAGAYTNIEAELDKDGGLYIYEVEYESNGVEYEYEIDAVTGEVVSWEAED